MCSKRHYTYALVFDSGKTDRILGEDSFRSMGYYASIVLCAIDYHF